MKLWYGGILPGFLVPKKRMVADVAVNDRPICVTAFGKNTYGYSSKATINRPEGRNDYLLSYLIDGEMYETSGKIPIKENSIILYKPHNPQIKYVKSESATTYWIHFSGNKVEEILKKYNLDSGVIELDTPFYHFVDIIDRMYVAKDNPYWQDICNTLLIELLIYISGSKGVKEKNGNYQKLIKYMQETCTQNLPIKAYADFIGFSEVYFVRFFKKASKSTPHNYLTGLKLKKACKMLLYTKKPINKIASETGFNTARYFSKVFYDNYSLTPTEYRKGGQDKN